MNNIGINLVELEQIELEKISGGDGFWVELGRAAHEKFCSVTNAINRHFAEHPYTHYSKQGI